MDFKALEYFVVCYEEQNVSRAAQKLIISQQGLSKSIHTLESELGIKLFQRSNSGIKSTAMGNLFYKHAKHLLSEYQSAIQALESEKKTLSGTIHVGIGGAVLPIIDLEAAIMEFTSLYPAIRIDVVNRIDTECEALILNGAMQFAFMMGPFRNARIDAALLCREDIHILLHRDNPLSKKQSLSVTDILNEQIITSDNYFKGQARLTAEFKKYEHTPNIIFCTNEPYSLRRLVLKQVGISPFPAHYDTHFANNDYLVIRTLSDMPPREIFMVCDKMKPQTHEEELFHSFIKKYYS